MVLPVVSRVQLISKTISQIHIYQISDMNNPNIEIPLSTNRKLGLKLETNYYNKYQTL